MTVAILVGYRYGITLWDWIELLIVPAVIAGGGIWFNLQQREREQQIANDRSQDEALQAYLDQMSQLLTDKERPLRRARPGDSLSTVARAQTLTILPRLNSERKASVLRFLHESGLIKSGQLRGEPTVLRLDGADLRSVNLYLVKLRNANLSGADLEGANLIGASLEGTSLEQSYLDRADLRQANLSGAFLFRAYLREADLREAYLNGTHLRDARLTGANLAQASLEGAMLDYAYLMNANLSSANLRRASLMDANLRGADLSCATGWTEVQLSVAKPLEGATMPNGQKYEDWLKSKD